MIDGGKKLSILQVGSYRCRCSFRAMTRGPLSAAPRVEFGRVGFALSALLRQNPRIPSLFQGEPA
jgi:hypothetical protein